MTKIKLVNLPFIDINYSNVIEFGTKYKRDEYFKKLQGYTTEKNIKSHSNIYSISLDIPIENLSYYDYLIVDDKFFYFIINKEVINTKNTILHLQLDVFNTYYYDIQFLPSFVDRCHVPRWNGDMPTYNMEDEEVGIGEYILKSSETIYEMGDGMIISASSPIGYVPRANGSGGGGSGGTGGSWLEGKLSSNGFRFIKGFEGFAPNKYKDSGGYWTIAYGVTAHGEPLLYTMLESESPLSEERAAKVSYDLKNENYGSKILQSVKNLGCTEQYQFDALCSVAYNSGNGSVTGSNSLTNAIAKNPKDESTIRPIWENFKITSNGVPLEGLRQRRKQECNMYFNQTFEKRPIAKIDSNGNISGTVSENNGNGWLPTETTGEIKGYKVFTNDFGKFMCPVKNAKVTSKYGWRTNPLNGTRQFHHGTDIGLPKGSQTVASIDGTITETGFHNSMGNYIYLDNENYRVKYMHLSQISVNKGAKVKQGMVLGLIGSTGDSTGAHCHWEIRRLSDNESTDPAPILKEGDMV